MLNSECIFCHLNQLHGIVYQDDKVTVIIDQDWVVLGHVLVIWNQHEINASDLTQEEFLYFSKIYHLTELAVLKLTHKPRAITLKTGGLINHFHHHIYPVDINTSWENLKVLFEKQILKKYSNTEKHNFINILKHQINQNLTQ